MASNIDALHPYSPRNRVYNRELEKYYGKYTKEIKDSFERGTAL